MTPIIRARGDIEPRECSTLLDMCTQPECVRKVQKPFLKVIHLRSSDASIPELRDGSRSFVASTVAASRKVQQYSGYQSEPEPAKDTDYSTIKYRTTNPQRLVSVSSNVNLRNTTSNNNSLHGLTSDPIKSGYGTYKNQPGRIENYITGHSSISEKEKKKWWDEVMDIFNNVVCINTLVEV
uniref:Uncharacterized protein n=1 Tax=Glossina austeni TaxID=7395 RepID=A0A1A9US84_GLOAU